MSRRHLLLAMTALFLVSPLGAQKPKDPYKTLPKRKALTKLIERYFAASESDRVQMRFELDRDYPPLPRGKKLEKLRGEILKQAAKIGPKIRLSGRHYFLDKKEKKGLYIAQGKGTSLWLTLHGGGVGQGSADNLVGAMGGLKSRWIFPEVLDKTEHGWTTSGTEEFVVQLIDAAKRSGKVDPDRIYITGHSMGGFGTWTLGAHHADVFGGGAAYAGAPTPYWVHDKKDVEVEGIEDGVLPSFFHLPLFFFQSLDDQNVPAIVNVFANKALTELKKEYPDGYNFRYLEVKNRGHAAPSEGYKPSQKWIMSHHRDPWPKRFLWQPVLKWKRHMYWLYWQKPQTEVILDAKFVGTKRVEITGDVGFSHEGMTIFVPESRLDVQSEITVVVEDKVVKKVRPQVRLSTLFMTMLRHDPKLLFNCRIDL